MDEAVAVGVRGRHREDVHLLVVEVDRGRVAVGQHGQRQIGVHLLHHAHAHPVVGENGDSQPSQVLVASDMVAVNVGVDHEADLAVVQVGDGGQDAFRQRGELVVHHDDAVIAHRQPDIAAGSFQVVHPAGHMVDGQRDRVPVAFLLSDGAAGGQQRQTTDSEHDSHELSPKFRANTRSAGMHGPGRGAFRYHNRPAGIGISRLPRQRNPGSGAPGAFGGGPVSWT